MRHRSLGSHGPSISVVGFGASPAGSLQRLKTDHVDLYQLHAPDPKVPLEESWEAIAQLADAGLTRWVGLSNVTADEVRRCEKVRHVDAVQNEFSLVHAGDRVALLPELMAAGTGYLGYGQAIWRYPSTSRRLWPECSPPSRDRGGDVMPLKGQHGSKAECVGSGLPRGRDPTQFGSLCTSTPRRRDP